MEQQQSVLTIMNELSLVYGDSCPVKTKMYKSHILFKQIRVSLYDDPKSIRSIKKTTLELIKKICKNCPIDQTRINSQKCFEIPCYQLGMTKVNARRVPIMLLLPQKTSSQQTRYVGYTALDGLAYS